MTTARTPENKSAGPDPAAAAQTAAARESASASITKAALTASETHEDVDAWAREVEQQMTDDERFSLIVSLIGPVPSIGVPRDERIPADVENTSAGYTPGVPRLGIPALQSSDASMGVTNPGYRPHDKGATAFASLVAQGSSFNPKLVREGGEAIAREARMRGFNVQLAGGCNLARDPRNGRNFEYFSEIPGTPPFSRPSRSTAFRVRASYRRSSTTRSTATRPIATGWTRSSTPTRTASPICSASRSQSSARSPAQS